MTPAQFRFLYINANLIAELALQRFVLDEPIEPPGAAPSKAPADEFGDLDLSALDGLDELIQQHTDVLNASSEPQGGEPVVDGEDLDAVLGRAYADPTFTEENAATLHQQVDASRLAVLLAALPPGAPSLASRLMAVHMEQWLDIHRGQDHALDELIVTLRSVP